MLVSRLSQKRFKVVNLTMINHAPKPIRLMKTAVAMDIKSYVAIKINIVNQFKCIGVKMQFTNSSKRCLKRLKKRFNKPLKMTENDELCFKLMDKCHICNKKYTDKDVRFRDHCHITGKFRGSAHRECNLKLRIKSEDIKIPVIFHNLRGYDSHFIMQQIGEIAKNHAYINEKGEKHHSKIYAIPNNMEKYMAFMLGNHLYVIESFQFMSSSLDKLVSNLPKEAFKYTSEEFIGKKLSLMSQKGVYPYDDYMDSFEKFIQTELPTKEQFYSVLNDQHVTNGEYDHARKVWETFNIKAIGEYHDLYLKSDVLLLADVFESFRKTCLQYYKLDSCTILQALVLVRTLC